LDDFVGRAARDLSRNLATDKFADLTEPIRAEDAENRIEAYGAVTDRLALLFAVGCRWGNQQHLGIWKDCLEIISQLPRRPGGWSTEYEISRCLRLYPASRAFYAGGMAAIIGNKFDTLRFLFHEPRIPFEDSVREPSVALTPWEVIARGKQHYISGNGRYMGLKAALSLVLHDSLQQKIVPLLNRPEYYSQTYDTFEYLLGLSGLVLIDQGVEGRDRRDALVGKFATRPDGLQFVGKMEAQLKEMKGDWPPLKARVIPGSYSECEAAMAAYRTEVELFQGLQRYGSRRPNKYKV
jgi:hypothetical protein